MIAGGGGIITRKLMLKLHCSCIAVTLQFEVYLHSFVIGLVGSERSSMYI